MRRSRKESRAIELRRGLASYVPHCKLAVGGMAEVWRGQATFTDGDVLPVAIKRALPELAKKPRYRTMLEDEARLGMLLRHENIVRVYDARYMEGTYILIMELVNGPSMRELMSRAVAQRAGMPVEPALRIGLGVARALAYAHGALDDFGRSLNIVHRDVSPQNVLLGSDGAIKLMDFGLAFASANHYEHDPNEIGGKLGYMAPEIFTRQQTTAAIDVFALGVTLWEALVGLRLFRGKTGQDTARRIIACQVPPLRDHNPRVPESLARLLERTLAKDPLARPSAAELVHDMQVEIQRAGIDLDDDCVPRLVRLHQRLQRVSKRPTVPDGEASDAAAELARELSEPPGSHGDRGVVVVGHPGTPGEAAKTAPGASKAVSGRGKRG